VEFRETPGGWLYDVKDRNLFDKKSVRRLELTKSVGVLVAMRPGRGFLEVQAIRFNKNAFDRAKCEEWVKKNLSITDDMVEKLAKKEVIPAQMLGISVDEQRVLAVLGYDAITKKNYERAEKIFRGLITLNPQANLGFTGMGKLRAEQGKTEEALKAFTDALKVFPSDIEALVGRGEILMKKGQKKAALPQFLQAAYLDGFNTEPAGARAREILTKDFTKQELADYVKSGEGQVAEIQKQIEAIKAGTPVLQATGGTRPSAAKPAAAPVAPPRPMRA